MLTTLVHSQTQTEYYIGLLKLVLAMTGFTLGTVLFFGAIYLIVYYSKYWR